MNPAPTAGPAWWRAVTRAAALTAALALAGCATAPGVETGSEDVSAAPPAEPARAEREPEREPEPEREAGTGNEAEPGTAARRPAPAVPPAPGPIRITLVGDIMLGGSAEEFMRRHGHDYAFAGIAAELARGDVVFGNLEGPLTDGGDPFPDKKYLFRTPPGAVAPALRRAGFDVVSLANNHTLDYGASGLYDTLSALYDAGIESVGAGNDLARARRAAVVEARGHSVGFLAYSNTYPEGFWATPQRPGTAFGHLAHVREDVAALRRRADTIVVSFHWGRESITELRDYQPLLARAAIDAGADIVAGHHPHILQGVEQYRDGIIFYSLGNFTFGSYSETARVSAIANVVVDADGPRSVELVPIDVYNPEVLFQPRPLEGEAATAVVEHLQSLAAPLDTELRAERERAVLELDPTPGAETIAADE